MAGQSGAGRADIAADSVFLFREQNRPFLRGTSPDVLTTHRVPLLRCGLAFLAAYAITPFFGRDLAVAASPLVAGAVMCLLFAFDGTQRDRRLARDGVVLPARVLAVRVQEDSESRIEFVDFAFVTPSGVALSGQAKGGPARSRQLPQEGEQVAIIYVNDRLFHLL